MIAPVEQPKLPLIQSYHVDTDKGLVTLIMPNVDDFVALSVKGEVDDLARNDNFPATFKFKHETGTVTITIQSDDVTMLAMNVTKLMTRRAVMPSPHLSTENFEVDTIKYAALSDIKSVLGSLKAHAQKTSSNAALAIGKLITTAE